jgi:hypothetical protein
MPFVKPEQIIIRRGGENLGGDDFKAYLCRILGVGLFFEDYHRTCNYLADEVPEMGIGLVRRPWNRGKVRPGIDIVDSQLGVYQMAVDKINGYVPKHRL